MLTWLRVGFWSTFKGLSVFKALNNVHSGEPRRQSVHSLESGSPPVGVVGSGDEGDDEGGMFSASARYCSMPSMAASLSSTERQV